MGLLHGILSTSSLVNITTLLGYELKTKMDQYLSLGKYEFLFAEPVPMYQDLWKRCIVLDLIHADVHDH